MIYDYFESLILFLFFFYAFQGIPVYSQDDSSISTASNSSSVTSSNEMDSTSGPKGRKEKILTNMVSRLQKIATKSKIVAKAAEKVSSYPLILSVEVKSLNGFLVLNMAPPPSDALWYVIVYCALHLAHCVQCMFKIYMYVQYVPISIIIIMYSTLYMMPCGMSLYTVQYTYMYAQMSAPLHCV